MISLNFSVAYLFGASLETDYTSCRLILCRSNWNSLTLTSHPHRHGYLALTIGAPLLSKRKRQCVPPLVPQALFAVTPSSMVMEAALRDIMYLILCILIQSWEMSRL